MAANGRACLLLDPEDHNDGQRRDQLDDAMVNAARERLDNLPSALIDRSAYEKALFENGNGPKRVALKPPNAWNLYDMLGNVWEWTNDSDDALSYERISAAEGNGTTGPKALRGGSWFARPGDIRASSRLGVNADQRRSGIGCRCALDEQ